MRIERRSVGNLVVPFVVDESRDPIDFKQLDPEHVEVCATQGRCGICGGRIRKGPVAFIGPDDGRTCFADPWMHPECAELATVQCPFVAGRRGWKGKDRDPLVDKYEENMVTILAYNWRAHREAGSWHFETVGPTRRVA